eukprot:GFUD01019450.1.p1 GENE.GFUD01019450.1~~GFUD01019450.1.p1  ORF type:complete len:795 (+),score=253.52 GFUD01019450.1:60-2444(+)
MSQTTLTSFFHARKHSLPEQQAAKRRKIVLEKHQIQDILENGNVDESSSEEEFEECQGVPESKENNDQEDGSPHSETDEFKDCIEAEGLEGSCSETKAEDDKAFEFVEDDDWEAHANNTLDTTVEESDGFAEPKLEDEALANHSISKDQNVDKVDVPPANDVVSSVVTSALDNHRTLPHPEFVTESLLATQEQQGTPSSGTQRENFRKSKKDEKEGKWTPKSTSEPLFTVGCGESAKSAKKKLNLSECSKNVVFQKLSSLSPRKSVQEKFNSPRKLNYESLSLRLTPQKNAISPFKKPGYSKNLFAETPEMLSPVKVDLSLAIQQAKTVQAKLTPAEVKSKLGKVKLADLKSRLASLSNSSLKAAQAKAVTTSIPPKIPSSITLQLDLPSSPSKRIPCSPHKSSFKASPRKVPAYQRFHNLARPANRTLPLPYSYRFLAEVFRCTDTVVSMLNNRKEIINLDKVSKSVTDLLRKKWDVKYLQQILCVFPQAYKLAWKRAEGRFGTNSEKREMQIMPNMAYKRDLMEELEGKMGNYAKMLPEHMVERRDIFRNSLVEMVKDHHEEFLASLDPPIVADRNALTSWHKEYDTESAPEVDIADLPEEPGKAGVTAKEVLEKAANFAGVNPKLSDVLRDASVKVEDSEFKKAVFLSSPLSAPSSIPDGLQGLNPSLIAKIKAKEAAKAKLEMTRNPEQVKRLGQLKKLPELARMIRNLFITEKKAALEVQFACKKLTSCLPYGTEKTVVEENMRLLTQVSKGWLKIYQVGTAEYFKMDKTDINKVCKKLDLKLKEALEK